MVAKKTRIMIMAGGTGGHVFPALAVAEFLRERDVDIIWMGTRRGMESSIVEKAGIPIEYISVTGLRGKGMLSWLFAPFKLVMALSQSIAVCRRQRPDAVLGMGGFVTGPGGLAAWILRKPLLIHEQNAIPGLTNRLLSYVASYVMEAFPASFAKTAMALHTGNPVRQDIAALEKPVQRLHNRDDHIRLLVIGGSLGALALNKAVPGAVALLDEKVRPQIWHQTGRNKEEQTRQAYLDANIEARADPFIHDMAKAYAWADVVICRSGALTVSELAAAGLAAILIPYPHAVDDHQTHNAAYLADEQAAVIIQQTELNAESLAAILTDYIREGREKLLTMANKARELAMPAATRLVAEKCLEAAHG